MTKRIKWLSMVIVGAAIVPILVGLLHLAKGISNVFEHFQ